MKHSKSENVSVSAVPAEVRDNGKVRIGGASPCLIPVKLSVKAIQDNGKVRIGGASPSL